MNSFREQARAAYWDNRIRNWAATSYATARNDLMSQLRVSVDARRDNALALLRRFHPDGDFTLLDLGCGTGRFALDVYQEFKPEEVVGVDFSAEAIKIACAAREDVGLNEDQVRFEVGTVAEPWPDSGIVTGLGLLDWLDEDQIAALFKRLRGRKFILSYSEKNWSPAELVHRFYLCYRLALTVKGVRAYHHTRKFMLHQAQANNLGNVEIVEAPEMRFGRLIHNLRRK